MIPNIVTLLRFLGGLVVVAATTAATAGAVVVTVVVFVVCVVVESAGIGPALSLSSLLPTFRLNGGVATATATAAVDDGD